MAHLTNALSAGSKMIMPIENKPGTQVIRICTFSRSFLHWLLCTPQVFRRSESPPKLPPNGRGAADCEVAGRGFAAMMDEGKA